MFVPAADIAATPAYQVTCPKCSAPAGSHCFRPNGQFTAHMPAPHVARTRLASKESTVSAAKPSTKKAAPLVADKINRQAARRAKRAAAKAAQVIDPANIVVRQNKALGGFTLHNAANGNAILGRKSTGQPFVFTTRARAKAAVAKLSK